MRTALKILAAAAILWGGAFMALSLPDLLAPKAPPVKIHDTREWIEAWACRCDTCCETLDRLEAEAKNLDVKEGAQR
jgi:hypothetical protein